MTEDVSPANPCPNCGAGVPVDARVCPNCGAGAAPLPELSGVPADEPTMTKHRWLDATLGVFTVLLSFVLPLFGFLGVVAVFFAVRKTYPVYARGIGWSLLASTAVFLGLFALCISSGFSH